jgi:hypothetical protein
VHERTAAVPQRGRPARYDRGPADRRVTTDEFDTVLLFITPVNIDSTT